MNRGMEISCDCDYFDYDPPEFYEEATRTARKLHECCECEQKIKPGQKYVHSAGAWQGQFATYRTCIPCARMRRDFCAPFCGLRDIIWEKLGIDIRTGRMREDEEDER